MTLPLSSDGGAMKVVVIFSGGMDSACALAQCCGQFGPQNILAISFDYSSKHNDAEYQCASKMCKALGVEHHRIDIKGISSFLSSNLLKSGGEIPEGHYAEKTMMKTVVPFRNGIMLAIACGIAESRNAKMVVIGNHAGDHAIYPDCRGTFISAMNEAMAYGTYSNVNIHSPFCSCTKADIVKIGDAMGVPWHLTYSCYKGGEVHCGRCSTCFERREAFYLAEVNDPTEYEDKTPIKQLMKEYEGRVSE